MYKKFNEMSITRSEQEGIRRDEWMTSTPLGITNSSSRSRNHDTSNAQYPLRRSSSYNKGSTYYNTNDNNMISTPERYRPRSVSRSNYDSAEDVGLSFEDLMNNGRPTLPDARQDEYFTKDSYDRSSVNGGEKYRSSYQSSREPSVYPPPPDPPFIEPPWEKKEQRRRRRQSHVAKSPSVNEIIPRPPSVTSRSSMNSRRIKSPCNVRENDVSTRILNPSPPSILFTTSGSSNTSSYDGQSCVLSRPIRRSKKSKKDRKLSSAFREVITEMETLYHMRSAATFLEDIEFWDSQISSLKECALKLCNDNSDTDYSSNDEDYSKVDEIYPKKYTTVIAPTDLPPGHTFVTTNKHGDKILATVPNNLRKGIKKGEKFISRLTDESLPYSTALTVSVPPPFSSSATATPQSSTSYSSASYSSSTYIAEKAQEHNKKNYVKVRAPATLPGGSRFHAKCGKRTILATVPSGGVKKNDIFKVFITNSSTRS